MEISVFKNKDDKKLKITAGSSSRNGFGKKMDTSLLNDLDLYCPK